MPEENLAIPVTPDAIDPSWLTLALRQVGVLDRAEVVAVDVTPIAAGSGFVGQAARLQITYSEQEASAPASVFAKLSSADPAVRQQLRRVGLYETEAKFYRDLAPLPTFPVPVPCPYLSLYDEATSACVLLIEDLGQAEFGDNLAGCSSTDAQLVVQQLGHLHAHFWNDPFLKELPWLRTLTDDAEARIALYRMMLPRFEQRCADFLTPSLVQSARKFAVALPNYLDWASQRPQTLTHGDFRADNFAFTTTHKGRGVTVFDWQVARRAPGPRDLAYFLSGSLPVELRRATEKSLLNLYCETLVFNGVEGYTAADLQEDVQAGLSAPLTTWVIAAAMLDFSNERGVDLIKRVCARLGAVLEDHHFVEYLDEHVTPDSRSGRSARLEKHEVYSAGYDPMVLQGLARRAATRDAAFFVPYLKPDMHVLDCGCGPGGISVTLAALVPQGRVVGVDIEDRQLDMGRQAAQQQGIPNVEFHHASLYALPFADGTFDAVLAHAVVYHLAEPMKALRELRRVLKPGGMIGLRDADFDGDVYYPPHKDVDRFWNLTVRVIEQSGGDARFGRKQRRLLREAGFRDIVASASSDAFGTTEMTAGFSRYFGGIFLNQHREMILKEQWATESELAAMQNALIAWGSHPDAFYARCRCEAVGWK
ncbi:MAG: methyltransferase domain-containing protein [Nitrospira sp.]|nr:methyltransferase domain-containing protein [Nitrospira sp.]